MYDYLEKSLKQFIANNTSSNIENAGSKLWSCELQNTGVSPKPTVNVVFSRYQGTEATETIIDKYGYVLAIPSYWIDINKTLVCMYVGSFVDSWIKKYFSVSNSTIENGHVCHHPVHMPPPPPPPHMAPPPPNGIPPHHHHTGNPPQQPPVTVVNTNDPSKFGYPVAPDE